MCGRFTITLTKEDFLNYLMRYDDLNISIDDGFLPRYNIAPSEDVLAMIQSDNQYRVGPIKWGLVPHFVSDLTKSSGIINARSETLLEKNAFKSNIISRRCIIFADSFYEWKNIDGRKIPYRIMLKDKSLFAFAGIWSINKNPDEPLFSAAIITTRANKLMESIHERMPVILSDSDIKTWLSPGFDQEKQLSLLKPYHSDEMVLYEVSTYVNKTSHKDDKCIQKI